MKCFQRLVAIVASLVLPAVFGISLQAQMVLFEEDFESIDLGQRGDWDRSRTGGASWGTSGGGASPAVVSRGSGKAMELSVDFSGVPSSGGFSWSVIEVPRSENRITSAASGDLSQLELNFDLWTSEIAQVRIRLEHDAGTGIRAEFANSAANVWQSYSLRLDDASFRNLGTGLDPTGQMGLAFGIYPRSTSIFEYTQGWGHDSGNVFRIDNISIEVVPEPSTYAFVTGLILLALVAFRRRQSLS